MKKISLMGALVVSSIFISANATTVNRSIGKQARRELRREKRERRHERWLHSASTLTLDQFRSDFPHATDVSWRQAAFAEASFSDDGVLKTAYYDTDNELVGTTTFVSYESLPLKARQFIEKRYPGYSVESIIMFDDNEMNNTDMILFNSRFSDEDTYFPVLSSGTEKIILRVTIEGNVSQFRKYRS